MIRLFFLLMFCSEGLIFSQENVIYVKVSIYDCMTCTSGLSDIVKLDKNVRLVLDAENVADSSGILDKYNLRGQRNNIIWDSKLYHALSKSDFSEIVQKCGEVEVQRAPLKMASVFKKIGCTSNGIAYCPYKTPQHFTAFDYNTCTILKNYISDAYYILNKENAQETLIYPGRFSAALLIHYTDW